MRTSLFMTSNTVRSVSMTNVIRLVGASQKLRCAPNIVATLASVSDEEREVEAVLVGELLLLLDLVSTYPDPLGADRLELGLHVTEVAALLRASRRS